MRNITHDTLTDAVLARLEHCEDPRLKAVLGSLITHLHAFVRETRLTEAEWEQGIRFLTETGQTCDDTRQEFILLSDTLGVSMQVVAQNHRAPAEATEATVFGPFHVEGAPVYEQGADIANGARGEPLFVDAVVVDTDGRPIADALVDVWQSDEDGFYDVQYAELGAHRARGILRTDDAGRLRFRSILPVAYPIPTDGPVGRMLVACGRHPWRPAHLHFMIRAAGYERLITHVFRDGDPYLDSDAVFGVRRSLVGDYRRHEPGSAPDGSVLAVPFFTLAFRFVLPPLTQPSAQPQR
jgi:hydroxyquinol 1,2-dioxygenase